MHVKDVMSAPVTVPEHATMKEVAQTMLDHGVCNVIVIDEEGAARGIITERDFVEHGELPYSEHGGPTILRVPLGSGAETAILDARTSLAKRIMRPVDVPLEEGDPIEKALDMMVHRGRKNIVVLRGIHPVGTVSHQDFLRLAAGEVDRQVRERARVMELA